MLHGNMLVAAMKGGELLVRIEPRARAMGAGTAGRRHDADG